MRTLNVARRVDAFVLRVYHIDLSECQDVAAFKQGLQLMMVNLDELLALLACELPSDRRIVRSAANVKLKATRLLRTCRALPDSFDDSKECRDIAGQIIASYEMLRIESGHL